jgi:acid stress-induced BolA-like protein IbaG/YrbA
VDTQKVEQMLHNIILAANSLNVQGENNLIQVLGICQSARSAVAELKKGDAENG